MSFLNQLKSQANALKDQQRLELQNFEANTAQTEAACQKAWFYLSDLARQLSVIEPAGARFTLDGKTPWPAMKLVNFRADARKKMLRNKEVYDYVAIGWDIVPQHGAPVAGTVSANFPPDLERIEKRLAQGHVEHERKEQRHPEKNSLLAIQFDYMTASSASVMITADHDCARLAFRLSNASGFEIINASWPADLVQADTLDELAKLILDQPSRFVSQSLLNRENSSTAAN